METEPTNAVSIEPAPQAAAMALIGGLWPAALSTAKPCPFCTTSTVIASGTTSSTIACQENAGRYRVGGAMVSISWFFESKLPVRKIATAPTINAPINGGSIRPSFLEKERRINARTIGAAIAMSSRTACTRPVPNRRNTPATIAITIGIGAASMQRRTQPVSPSASISAPQPR